MSTAATRRLTEEEYLAIERASESKHEYFDGEVFAMAGASLPHNRIVGNILSTLDRRLRGSRCEPLPSDMRIHIPSKRKFTYADVLVVCGTPQFAPGPPDNLLNPRLIVEVLSPSTELYDRTAKFRHYQSIASFAEYLLVEQDEPLIDCFTRGANGLWSLMSYAGTEGTVKLQSIDCELSMPDIYNGVEFSQVPLRAPTPDDPTV